MKFLAYFTLILTLSGCGAVVGFGVKEVQGGRIFEAFKTLDTNADGQTSLGEIIAARTASFSTHDQNSDGWIDQTEYQHMQDQIPKRKRFYVEGQQTLLREDFSIADENHDGKLTLVEYQSGSDRIFAVLDVNGDGHIGRNDFQKLGN